MSETDYIRLAEELAVRGIPDADAVVEEQIARTKNPDRKAQLEFVRPALASDAGTRDALVRDRLSDLANRRREPWVLDGLRYLHHPLRTDASEQYIAPSLDMLREIQRTGDIFFPKRWMDVTLSGYRSPSAASTVRAFPRSAAADLSGPAPADHPLVGRRPVQSRGPQVTTCRTTFDRAMPRIAPRDPWRASATRAYCDVLRARRFFM